MTPFFIEEWIWQRLGWEFAFDGRAAGCFLWFRLRDPCRSIITVVGLDLIPQRDASLPADFSPA
jgi:hypothetical protein